MVTLMQEEEDLQELADKFAIVAADTETPVEPEQQPFEQRRGHLVNLYMDGSEYFRVIEDEIDNLIQSSAEGRYFYLSAWWLGLIDIDQMVTVDPGVFGASMLANFTDAVKPWPSKMEMSGFRFESGKLLCDSLVAMSKAGVDVRVLSWTSPFAPRYQQVANKSMGISQLNLHTILSTQALRDQLGGSGHAILNTLSHPLGGAHLKIIVCGDTARMRAYSGGMDPVANRLDLQLWHDAAVCVEGPAAAAAHKYFEQLWNEQLTREPEIFIVDDKNISSHLKSTPKIPKRSAAPAQGPAYSCVQTLRTVPKMNFSLTGPEWLEPNAMLRALLVNAMGFKKDPLSFAPQGIFEFKAALHKMIVRAEKYIFITDQCFSSQEVMGWLNQRLTDHSDVKIILLHGPDPSDPPSGSMQEAVNRYLLADIQMSAESASGIENLAYYNYVDTVAHGKVIIVDDKACIIGSANCGMRRSLYTDIEHSVSIVDVSKVKILRRRMWARYCKVQLNSMPNDVADGLYIWDQAWAPSESIPGKLKLSSKIRPYTLPIKEAEYSKDQYDQQDPDSRRPF
jgi:phosphatidylserine/phosphatidylglycerophosphate/cardiolipin synthase-like enzyme